ncbi:MFS transporter [Desulfitobacterium sp. Sab5]|uniref:MFS transporter n=1 Tax=Desulfitobacterium nosdiversum TaxID=3375356 RepID=UPI003CE69BF6
MNPKIGNKRWLIIVQFLLCYLVLYMDRSNMSIAGPSMMKEFNWSATQFGLVSTAFFMGYACTMIIGGWLADRFGGGKVIIFGALWWSIFVFLTPFGTSLGLMVIIRMMMGMGEGVALPAISSMVAKWIPKKEAGLAQGICLVGVPLGITLTMPFAAWIIQAHSWKMVFWTFAFTAPIWILIWLRFGKDKPENDPNLSQEELAYIKSTQDGSQEMAGRYTDLTPKDIFSTPSVWTGAVSFFCTNYLFYLFMTWLPTYFMKGRGLQLGQSALYTMMPYIVAVFTYPIGGYLADKAAAKFEDNMGRKIFPVFGMISAGILLILGSQAANAVNAVALISASNGLLCLTMGGYYSMPMVFSRKNAGKITGLWSTFATIGGITAPLLTGVVVDAYGYTFALYLGAGISIIGSLILLTTVRIKEIKPKNASEIIPELH